MNAQLETEQLSAAFLDDASESLAGKSFEVELARLDCLIHREILRLRARYELSLDEFRGLYVSDEQVDALIRNSPQVPDDEKVEALDQLARQLGEESGHAATVSLSPWATMIRSLGLTGIEKDVLLLALAPELDSKYETLFAYLNNDVTRKLPTVELAARLFGNGTAARAAVSPASKLIATKILEYAAGSAEIPRARRGLRVVAPLVDWLQGLSYIDERLLNSSEFIPPGYATASYQPATARRLIDCLAAAAAGDQPIGLVVCTAAQAGEARAAARMIFNRAGRPALEIDLHALLAAPVPHDLVAGVILMHALFRVGIVAQPFDALFDAESRVAEGAVLALRELFRGVSDVALAGSTRTNWRALLDEAAIRNAIEVNIPEPTAAERFRAWCALLGPHEKTIDVAALADRFALEPERIAWAIGRARRQAELSGQLALTTASLFDAARSVSATASSGVTRGVRTVFAWDDLVLPVLVKKRLNDIVRAIELRPRVLDQWGFAGKMDAGRGLKILFAGASGTGKTMAAAIVAKTLALDLHRVELSAVVSKYIGETEKNLDRAFETARSANAILFVDEADALFGKRSEVKDAHDRYANVETAYLLQKMEDHDGVVILATNLANNIDDAFSRRMHYVVEFPQPDVRGREQIWRNLFPAGAPLAGDVDFTFLARQFSFAGGDIRNIVLDAAYAAAQDDAPIGMAHLVRAVARQYAKLGKVPSAGEFREYFGLLTQSGDNAACVGTVGYAADSGRTNGASASGVASSPGSRGDLP